MPKCLPIIFAFFLSCLSVFGQSKADSLKTVLKTAQEDTLKVKTLNQLGGVLLNSNDYPNAMRYARASLDLSEKLLYKRGEGKAYALIGVIYEFESDYPNALKNFATSVKIMEDLGDKRSVGDSYSDMGVIYLDMGNYPEALKSTLLSLRIREELRDSLGIGRCYGNIGNIYELQGNYEEALKNNLTAYKIFKDVNALGSVGRSLGNIGNIYAIQGNYAEALKCQREALQIKIKVGNKISLAYSYGNLGSVFNSIADKKRAKKESRDSIRVYLDSALKYHLQAAAIREEVHDKQGTADSYINLGSTFTQLGDLKKAGRYLNDALAISKEIGHLEWMKDAYLKLSELDTLQGNYAQSLAHYKAYIACRDSLFNEENTKKSIQQQMQYEFDKKDAAAKLEQEKKEAVAETEKKKQRFILVLVSCFLVLVAGFAVFAYRSFLQKKKANIEINRQKQLIEEKQKEILDSIYYARRIQRTLLPAETNILKLLKKLQKE